MSTSLSCELGESILKNSNTLFLLLLVSPFEISDQDLLTVTIKSSNELSLKPFVQTVSPFSWTRVETRTLQFMDRWSQPENKLKIKTQDIPCETVWATVRLLGIPYDRSLLICEELEELDPKWTWWISNSLLGPSCIRISSPRERKKTGEITYDKTKRRSPSRETSPQLFDVTDSSSY